MIFFLKAKSRFGFNISIKQNISFFFKTLFNLNRKKSNVKNTDLFNFYSKSNIYLLEHGRSAFYLFLLALKKKNKKKENNYKLIYSVRNDQYDNLRRF